MSKQTYAILDLDFKDLGIRISAASEDEAVLAAQQRSDDAYHARLLTEAGSYA